MKELRAAIEDELLSSDPIYFVVIGEVLYLGEIS